MSELLPTEPESLKARVFDGKGWNKAFVEGALIHDLWAEVERLRGERDIHKAQAAAHWQAIEALQRMVASSAHETPTCPTELMGPRPCTGTYCEDEEREDLEAEWLEEHPPGSACTSGCGYCGRCT